MRHSRGCGSRRTAWIGGVLALALPLAVVIPGRGWAQDTPPAYLSLPLVTLEERGAPLAFDCSVAPADVHVMLRDRESTLPAAACAGAPLGFSSAGSRFGWFGALGKWRYLAALPALLAVGGGGGGGGGGDASGAPDEVSHPALPERDKPSYREPVPEPTSTVLLVTGSLLVAGALRQRRR